MIQLISESDGHALQIEVENANQNISTSLQFFFFHKEKSVMLFKNRDQCRCFKQPSQKPSIFHKSFTAQQTISSSWMISYKGRRSGKRSSILISPIQRYSVSLVLMRVPFSTRAKYPSALKRMVAMINDFFGISS